MPKFHGRRGRDMYNGAIIDGDETSHVGAIDGQTICKKRWSSLMMTYGDVEITCPDCVEAVQPSVNTDGVIVI